MRSFFLLLLTVGASFGWISLGFAQTPQELFNQAQQSYRAGDYEKAIEFYEKVIDLDSNFAKAYNALGLAYKATNAKPSEIAWYFKAAIDIDPNYAEAYDNLGKAYYGMGDFDRAEEYCKKALAINPDLGSAEFSLAWIYLLGKSQPAEAISYFKNVIAKKKIAQAYYGLGLAYFMNEERALVLEIITELRNMGEDKLATQLENVIRGHYYVPSQTAGPLIDIEPQFEKQEGILIPAGSSPQKVREEPPQTDTQSVGGVTQIRLKGKLFNVGDVPPGEPSAGTTQTGQKEDTKETTPAAVSPLKITGTPQVISGEDARMQRIRALQRKNQGY